MSKKRENTARTNPPDRDGDGRPGGSLPGNETVEAAKGPAAETAPAETGTSPGDPNRSDDGPPNSDATPPPQPEGATEGAAWARDNELIQMKLEEAGVRGRDEEVIDLPIVTQWPDEDARAAEAFADAMLADGKYTDDEGIERNADGSAIDLPEILHERTVISGAGEGAAPQDDEPDPSDTFTPEEVAAGRTPVIEQEGEATTTAADTATVIDPADPLVTVDTDTAPVAVRLSELGVLVSSRRLYETAEGYTATYGAPFIDAATVEGWIKAGLAERIPSAGNTGGVRATAAARGMAARLRREQQAEAA